jgi:hypothetical protein
MCESVASLPVIPKCESVANLPGFPTCASVAKVGAMIRILSVFISIYLCSSVANLPDFRPVHPWQKLAANGRDIFVWYSKMAPIPQTQLGPHVKVLQWNNRTSARQFKPFAYIELRVAVE